MCYRFYCDGGRFYPRLLLYLAASCLLTCSAFCRLWQGFVRDPGHVRTVLQASPHLCLPSGRGRRCAPVAAVTSRIPQLDFVWIYFPTSLSRGSSCEFPLFFVCLRAVRIRALHENQFSQGGAALRLSYYGGGHYDSILTSTHRAQLLTTAPGMLVRNLPLQCC